jgi:hypothetical protein
VLLVYMYDEAFNTLHAQHWWFSGKIGRCHEMDLISSDSLISASPGFDSRPMHLAVSYSWERYLFVFADRAMPRD